VLSLFRGSSKAISLISASASYTISFFVRRISKYFLSFSLVRIVRANSFVFVTPPFADSIE
jgi:hypothetical protein